MSHLQLFEVAKRRFQKNSIIIFTGHKEIIERMLIAH